MSMTTKRGDNCSVNNSNINSNIVSNNNKPTSFSGQLLQRQQTRIARQNSLQEQAKAYAAIFKAKEDAILREKELEAISLRQEEEMKKFRLAEERRKEIEFKTKKYFDVNKFNRKIPAPDNPIYFGDIKSVGNSWLPHGRGQFLLRDVVKLDGEYKNGFLEGEARILWDDSTEWIGQVKDSVMEGIGTIILQNGKTRTAMAKKGVITCFQDELVQGQQIEFQEPLLQIFASGSGGPGSRKPRAVILHHVQNWKYLCRFHDEVWPKERVVDLQVNSLFKVLQGVPLIHNLSSSSTHPHLCSEACRIDDYRNDHNADYQRKITAIQRAIQNPKHAQIIPASPSSSVSLYSGGEESAISLKTGHFTQKTGSNSLISQRLGNKNAYSLVQRTGQLAVGKTRSGSIDEGEGNMQELGQNLPLLRHLPYEQRMEELAQRYDYSQHRLHKASQPSPTKYAVRTLKNASLGYVNRNKASSVADETEIVSAMPTFTRSFSTFGSADGTDGSQHQRRETVAEMRQRWREMQRERMIADGLIEDTDLDDPGEGTAAGALAVRTRGEGVGRGRDNKRGDIGMRRGKKDLGWDLVASSNDDDATLGSSVLGDDLDIDIDHDHDEGNNLDEVAQNKQNRRNHAGEKGEFGAAFGKKSNLLLNSPTQLSPSSWEVIPHHPVRAHTARKENFFESREVGIGAAMLEEEKRVQEELKKEQWASLVAERRQRQEEERMRQLEEEQNRYVAESLLAQKEQAALRKREKEEHEKATQEAVEEELRSIASR